MQILFEDNHVLVVEKPANVPTQADRSGDADMVTLLKEDLKQRYNKPGNVYLGLIHRLDRPVGGAMVFAKTSKAASRLSDAVRRGKLERRYLAVLRGAPPRESGSLAHYILKDSRANKVAVFPHEHKKAKQARLDYRLLRIEGELSLVYVKLVTGRPHQIRAQFAYVGCPLYGDQKYGFRRSRPREQIALWSCRIAFPHPISGETITLMSLPDRRDPWSIWSDHLHSLCEEGEASLPNK